MKTLKIVTLLAAAAGTLGLTSCGSASASKPVNVPAVPSLPGGSTYQSPVYTK